MKFNDVCKGFQRGQEEKEGRRGNLRETPALEWGVGGGMFLQRFLLF